MQTTAARTAGRAIEHRFYAWLALALAVTVFIGFSRSFFLRPLFPEHPSPEGAAFYWHGLMFAAWFALLAIQPRLIARGKVAGHQALGAAGAVLALLMTAMGLYVALLAAARPGGFIGVPVSPLSFLVMPLFSIALFALYAALAVAKRRVAQSHKRLMILASIALVEAAVARLPLEFMTSIVAIFVVVDLFLLALAIWDLATLKRLHPVTLWGGLVLVVSQPLRLLISGTESWLRFADWAVALVR